MLNAEIIRYNYFGSKEGLFFVYRHIKEATLSVASLKQFVIHNPGHIDVDVDAAILLFSLVGILDYNVKSDSINVKDSSIITLDDFISFLSTRIVDFILKENLINIETVTFDSQQDRFYINRKCIQLKFACFRNLLLTLNVFENRTNNTYFICSDFVRSVQRYVMKRKTTTQEELLAQLKKQAEQGECGEMFVLEYEKKRLKGHHKIEAIKQVSAIDVSAGYDIVSFNDLSSNKLDRFIEVKTYLGKPHFHWSSNEMDIARLRANHYYIYLVSLCEINKDGYEPLIIQNPISFFKNNPEWSSIIDGVTISKQ